MSDFQSRDAARILILEDDRADVELIERELRQAGIAFVLKHVEEKESFERALSSFAPDLILSDYNLPAFDGLKALSLAKEKAPLTPFILVSGIIGEDMAVNAIKSGATDYVLKDHLGKLPFAVERALNERGSRRRRQEAEKRALAALQARLKEIENGGLDFDQPAKILIVEDLPDDFELMKQELQHCGLKVEIRQAETEKAMRKEMIEFDPDLVLADFWLPHFDGFKVFEIARSFNSNIPVILISGVLGEEIAIDSLKLGLTDYVMKDRLARLPQVVRRALAEIAETRLRKQAELAAEEAELHMSSVVENLVDPLITVNEHGIIQSANKACEEVFGWTAAELLGKNVNILMPSPFKEEHDMYIARYLATGERRIIGIGREVVARRKDGSTFPADLSVSEYVRPGKRVFTGIVRDITVKKQKEEALRKIALLEQREDFLSTLTHDLKNPLLGLKAILNSFLGGQVGSLSEEQEQYLRICKTSNEALLLMLQNLIEVLRYEHDMQTTVFENTDLLQLVNACLQEFATLASQKQIRLTARLPESLQGIPADANSIRRVLQNLITNALKFTPEGGIVEIALNDNEHYVVLTVSDNGPGLTEEDQSQLFQRFWKGSAGKGTAASTGLGLYLCKQIVDAHHGLISCSSRANQGSTFTVHLPLRQPATAA